MEATGSLPIQEVSIHRPLFDDSNVCGDKQDSSVCAVTRMRLDDRGPGEQNSFSKRIRSALRSTQPLKQLKPGTVSLG
jgi:hypothetical protein